MLDAVNGYLGFPKSGLAGLLAPSGTHPGGEHHDHGIAAGTASGTSPVARSEA